MAVVIIAMAVTVLPINVVNVLYISWLGEKEAGRQPLINQFIKNPVIIASITGLLINISGQTIYTPLENTLELLSRATLPIGLLLVGAGLRLRLPRSSLATAFLSAFFRLLLAPVVYYLIASWFGLSGQELVIVVLCGGVPTAMSGYLLAKHLGGDAPLMAAIMTIHVALSFFTIPLVIWMLGI